MEERREEKKKTRVDLFCGDFFYTNFFPLSLSAQTIMIYDLFVSFWLGEYLVI